MQLHPIDTIGEALAAVNQQQKANHRPSPAGEPGDLRDCTRATETYLLTAYSTILCLLS